MPRRDTCTYGAVDVEPALFGGRLAVDHTPITLSFAVVMHEIGNSIAMVVTFLYAVALPEPLRDPITFAVGIFTRSKISPRFTPKPSRRWPTNTRGND